MWYARYEKASPNNVVSAGYIVDSSTFKDDTHEVSDGFHGDMPRDLFNAAREPNYTYNPTTKKLVKK